MTSPICLFCEHGHKAMANPPCSECRHNKTALFFDEVDLKDHFEERED